MHSRPTRCPSTNFFATVEAWIWIIIAGTLIMLARSTLAAPFRPVDGATVIYVAPRSLTDALGQARDLRARLDADPADLAAALQVARLAVREGRASADPRLYGRAQAALAPWWDSATPPREVRVLRAVIRQALHDFSGADADLASVLAEDPGNGQARLTRAFVLQATGAIDRAAEECRELPRSVGPTVAASCVARVAALTGRGEPALRHLVGVLALDRRADPTLRRFATGVAAEIAVALGHDREAERLLAEAAEGGDDLPSLVAYADFLLDAGRAAEVLPLLSAHSSTDAGLLRLAIAGKAVSDPRTGGWVSLLAERFSVARAGAGPLHLREEARFELALRDNPHRALALAREGWSIEKEPQDTRLVLDAALAAGEFSAADEVLGFIAATGLVDVRIDRLRQAITARRAGAADGLLDRSPGSG